MLRGTKLRALPGGVSVAQRQEYKTTRGTIFSKQKQKKERVRKNAPPQTRPRTSSSAALLVTKEHLYERAKELGRKFPYTNRGNMRSEEDEGNFMKQRHEMTFFILGRMMREVGFSSKPKRQINRALALAYQRSKLNGNFQAVVKSLRTHSQELKQEAKDISAKDWEKLSLVFHRISKEMDVDPKLSGRM